MYCTSCGTALDNAARYCTACGRPTAPDVPPAAGTAAPPARKLRRIVTEKKLAGVCAGFAEYFEMDVTIMRLIWVALAVIPPNVGIIGYIVAWIVLPR